MGTIIIDAEHRDALTTAHVEWQRSLPRQPGQLGATTQMLVQETELPSNRLRFDRLDPSFVEFVRSGGNVPFVEE